MENTMSEVFDNNFGFFFENAIAASMYFWSVQSIFHFFGRPKNKFGRSKKYLVYPGDF